MSETKKPPEALRLAAELEYACPWKESVERSAAAELRRLHAALAAPAAPVPLHADHKLSLLDEWEKRAEEAFDKGWLTAAGAYRECSKDLKAAAPAAPAPLTNDHALSLAFTYCTDDSSDPVGLIRAVEAAHGIAASKGEQA